MAPLVLFLVFAAVSALAWTVLSTIRDAVRERAAPAASVAGATGAAPGERPDVPDPAKRRMHAAYGSLLGAFLLATLLGAGPVRAAVFGFAAAIAGSAVPVVLSRREERKRRAAAESQILELATGLANGLRSGQALPAALDAISGRLPAPLSEEVATVLREYRLGVDLPDALARMSQRLPCEDLTLLVGAIRLTQQAGGSLAEVLDKMVEMIRGRTEFQAKLKTMTSQGRFEAVAMSCAPLAVFVLLFLIDRPLMLPLVTTTAGWTAIVFDFVWVSLGFLIIRRIVTIEV